MCLRPRQWAPSSLNAYPLKNYGFTLGDVGSQKFSSSPSVLCFKSYIPGKYSQEDWSFLPLIHWAEAVPQAQ